MNRRSFLSDVGGTAIFGSGSDDAPRSASGSVISIATIPLSQLVYRVKSGKLTYVSAVRDRGIELKYDGDFATKTHLLSAALFKPGHAGTCIAEGLIALGALPDGPITLDGEGADLEQRSMAETMLAGAVEKSYFDALVKAGLLIGASA